MSQRKLNRRQSWRAEKIQSERNQRALKKDRDLGRKVQSGELSSEQQGLVICRDRQHFQVEALEGSDKGLVHQCVSRTNLGMVVAGDCVVWRSGAGNTGVIESLLPRASLLSRPDNFGKLKPVAANIDQMLIVIACEPAPQKNLIDRYLVAAELMSIRPVIILNKSDLMTEDNRAEIDQLLKLYLDLDYQCKKIVCSRHQALPLEELAPIIEQRTSIIVGQSGVGKSSLINALLPNADLKVGALSEQTREGTHTTTKAMLFHLPDGGQLIDSPGIRNFSLWHIDQTQLQSGFVEIAKQLGHCRFRDCKHEYEPGCAVMAAVENGKIGQQRFNSYLKIKAAIQEQQARGLTLDE